MALSTRIIGLVLLSFSFTSSFGQDVIKQKSCNSDAIKVIADSLKAELEKGGYTLLREASMAMESEYEMPVIVPLNDGSWYHVIFIGDPTSRLIELRMFDWNEKQVIYQKSKNDNIVDADGNNNNVLSYTYAPKFSEYHMIKPVQVNKKKKKDICGYIMLFKRTK